MNLDDLGQVAVSDFGEVVCSALLGQHTPKIQKWKMNMEP